MHQDMFVQITPGYLANPRRETLTIAIQALFVGLSCGRNRRSRTQSTQSEERAEY